MFSSNRRNVVYYFAPRPVRLLDVLYYALSASVPGVLRCAVVDADFYAPAVSKEYLPVRRKRLLEIAVFGLVGQTPIIGARSILDGALYWRVSKYESILFRAAARCVVGD